MPGSHQITSPTSTSNLGITPGGVVICNDPASPLHASFTASEPAALIALGGQSADPAADSSILFWKSIAAFLTKQAPAWSRVGRVTLHLAENKNDPEYPFAFMATYASGISQSGRLTPLHAAAKSCQLMAELVESGDVFHPLAWTPPEAYALLRTIPAYEEAGLLVRLPNWWQ